MTYTEGINITNKLIERLKKTNCIQIENNIEFNILHDALVTYMSELESELRRQEMIKQFNNLRKK